MDEDLSVCVGPKAVAQGDQLTAELAVVIDLAVVCHPHALVLVRHRLRPGNEIDDAQTTVPQPRRATADEAEAGAVRPAMTERVGQTLEALRHVLALRRPHQPADPAHLRIASVRSPRDTLRSPEKPLDPQTPRSVRYSRPPVPVRTTPPVAPLRSQPDRAPPSGTPESARPNVGHRPRPPTLPAGRSTALL